VPEPSGGAVVEDGGIGGGHDDAVVAEGVDGRKVPARHVVRDQRGIALPGIAVAPAARGAYGNGVAGDDPDLSKGPGG
jgi:hypothetical protein